MRKLKIVIFLLIIAIIVLISVLLSYYNNKEMQDEEYIFEDIPEKDKTSVEEEKGIGTYMLADELIENFFSYITEKNANIQNNEAAYALLKPDYIKSNNITSENILKYFEEYKEMKSYSTKEIYEERYLQSQEVANLFLYMKGIVRINGNIEDVYIYMNQDLNNSTFYISFLQEEEYNQLLKNGHSDVKRVEIEDKEYNKLYVKTATDYDVCLEHMQEYKKALENNEEEAYNMLDEEYRNKRFGSLEKFKQYRQEKQETYGKENFTEYLVNDYDGYKEYVCKDQYGNLYIFTEEYPMQYTLKLDTYTIDTEKFITEYENGNEQTKVQLCINKFILMLNNQDYEAAYKVLDENFKNTNFSTQEEFNAYIKNNTYRYNNLEFTDFDVVGNTYSCKVTLTDLIEGKYVDENKGTGESGYVLDWNFVIQLKENREFILAFEI